MRTFLLIGLGGALGAWARWALSGAIAARWGGTFPLGTFLVNASGCFAIGFFLTLVAARFGDSTGARALVATGFLGAYTTFSTFSFETVTLLRAGAGLTALGYVISSLLLGLAATAAGILLARAL
ncbi:MAG: Fluoride ion transporter CrcB [uncultured Thermomicrobiales bacterium]|uniref:Fluoride-specific ion channel FluC n=1 Tax=uncultured Thermomicrobiales bacterium TaxID=1645740 RepID=A0A6J4UT87_9BACT|nr:MAG: Fluoride ion transporter CrcB [uncultured Thermomicrobiales bacterium]